MLRLLHAYLLWLYAYAPVASCLRPLWLRAYYPLWLHAFDPRGFAPSFFIYFIINSETNSLFTRPEFSPQWGNVEEPLHYGARVSSRLSGAPDFVLRV